MSVLKQTTLSTDDPKVSPMIDLDRVNMITIMDRLNSKVTDYASDRRVNSVDQDPSAAIYLSKVFIETKRRPYTIIKKICNVNSLLYVKSEVKESISFRVKTNTYYIPLYPIVPYYFPIIPYYSPVMPYYTILFPYNCAFVHLALHTTVVLIFIPPPGATAGRRGGAQGKCGPDSRAAAARRGGHRDSFQQCRPVARLLPPSGAISVHQVP